MNLSLKRSADSMLPHELLYRSMTLTERIPDHCAPGVDGLVSLAARWSCHHLSRGHRTSFTRQWKYRPTAPLSAERHVRSLNLSPRESLLDVEVESDERECQRNRFGVLVGLLRGPRVDDVLMNKCRMAVSERVALQ